MFGFLPIDWPLDYLQNTTSYKLPRVYLQQFSVHPAKGYCDPSKNKYLHFLDFVENESVSSKWHNFDK